MTIINCSWYTGASSNAIGYYSGSSVEFLATNNWGTDEPDAELLMHKEHEVYAQEV
jgi:hypothetical protein